MFTLLELCNYDVRIRHREDKTRLFGCSQADITCCFVLPVLLASVPPVCRAAHAVLANDGAFAVRFCFVNTPKFTAAAANWSQLETGYLLSNVCWCWPETDMHPQTQCLKSVVLLVLTRRLVSLSRPLRHRLVPPPVSENCDCAEHP